MTKRPISLVKIGALLLLGLLVYSMAVHRSGKIHNTIYNNVKDVAIKDSIPAISMAYKFSKGEDSFTIFNPHFYSAEDIVIFTSGKQEPVYQAASLSKVVFAYIVNKMAVNGEIDLDKPLAEYTDIERFSNDGKEMAKRITARVVLKHRTGLPNWSTSPSSKEWPNSTINFKFAVDSCFGYSGEGFALLQRAVEKIKGAPIEEIAKREVFEPLGMVNSSYCWLDRYDDIALDGYNRAGENRGKGRHPRANVGYTLRTTAKDYIKFANMLLRDINDKSPYAMEMVSTLYKGDQPIAYRYADRNRECDSNIFWGNGVGVEKHPIYGDIIWHWGDNGSFKAMVVIIPSKSISLCYFTNSAHGHDILNSVLSNFISNPSTIYNWIAD